MGALVRGLGLFDLYHILRKPTAELSAEQNAQVGRALQLEVDNR